MIEMSVDAGRGELPLGDRGVDAVAVQPRAGVDDHVVDAGLGLDAAPSSPEDGTAVHCGRASAGLDELGDDLGVQLGGAPLAGGALRR